MKAKELPPLSILQEMLCYNSETGELHWKKDRNTNKVKDKRAGWTRNGYIVFSYGKSTYYVHRVAYALYYGEQLSPDVVIDHKDGDKSNNRVNNLRKVTYSANNHNRKLDKKSTSGHRGVTYSKTANKWQARLTIDGRQLNLGYFDCKEDAITARLNAEREYNIFVR
jgi:hypothetical protein